MDGARVLDEIRRDPRYRDQIVHEETFPARPARYADPAWPLPAPLADALTQRGVTRLFTHQAAALDAIRNGESVIVTTGTASGKTLCYLLPVLETLTRDPDARALFIYPTKALAQDQADAIGEFASLIPGLVYGTYDGDTPADERRRLRQAGRILLTNPDMLHVGILPQHFRWWRPFLRSLRYVVLDDMHVYRGVFGSHVGLVLRRLWRACRVHGSEPQVICTSATIANPEEFGGRLTGRPVRLVDDDGAPRAPRRFVLWNPPVVARAGMRRRSPYSEAAWLLASLVRQSARTIVFTKARKITELVYRYATDALSELPALAAQLSPYRAGYLAKERRAIEQRLFRGELLGVVSTSALELGIDVGALDALGEAPLLAAQSDPAAVAQIATEARHTLEALAQGAADPVAAAEGWARSELPLRLRCFENWLTERIYRSGRDAAFFTEVRPAPYLSGAGAFLNIRELFGLVDQVRELRATFDVPLNRGLALEALFRRLTPPQRERGRGQG